MTNRAEILLHPVRLRVVQALIGRDLTTRQLSDELPGIAPATLYRHVARLADAGVIEVAATRKVRGRRERTYRLVSGAAVVGREDVVGITPDEHLVHLQVFVASLLEQADRYLHSQQADPAGDGFGYRQLALWLDDDELENLVEELREVVGRYMTYGPAPSRRRRAFATLVVPDPPAARGGERQRT